MQQEEGSITESAGVMHRAKSRRLVARVTGPAMSWRVERAAQGSVLRAGERLGREHSTYPLALFRQLILYYSHFTGEETEAQRG